MKKTVSVVLALVLVLSLGCLPAWAASSIQVPWTVTDQTNGVTYTASYNASKKTLTYKAPSNSNFINSDGEYEYDGYTSSEMILFSLAQQSNVSQKTQNEILAYEHYSIWAALSNPVRSGKVKKITIKTPMGTDDYSGKKLTLIYNYEFTLNKKSQVTKCSYEIYINNSGMEGSDGYYELSYDTNGDLKSVYDQLSHSPEHTTTFGYSNGKLNKLNVKSDVDGESRQIFIDNSGRPIQVKADNSIFYTYNSNGRLNSYKIDYGEDINGYHNSKTYTFNYDSTGRFGSTNYTYSSEGKVTSTNFTFTYQSL